MNNRSVETGTESFTGSLAYTGIVSSEADRQLYPKARLAGSGRDLDPSPVLVDDDVVGDMQAKARAYTGSLRGKEGLENARLNLLGYPRSVVDDVDRDNTFRDEGAQVNSPWPSMASTAFSIRLVHT